MAPSIPVEGGEAHARTAEQPAPGFTTPTESKKRKLADVTEGGLTLAGERVVMWNTREQRKVSGNAAPMIKNLKSYLKRHPDREIYARQDEAIDRVARAQSRALAMLAKAVGADPPPQPSSSAAAPVAAAERAEDAEEMSADPADAAADELDLIIRRRNERSTPFYPFIRASSPSPEALPRGPFYPPLSLEGPDSGGGGGGGAESECEDAVSLPPDADDERDLSPPGSPSIFLAEWLPPSPDDTHRSRARSRGSAGGEQGGRKQDSSQESTTETRERSGIWAEGENGESGKPGAGDSPCCVSPEADHLGSIL